MYLEIRQKNTRKARAESALRKKKNQLYQVMLKRLSKTNASHAPSYIARAKQPFSFVNKVLDAI